MGVALTRLSGGESAGQAYRALAAQLIPTEAGHGR
jgi:hypothetical protein